jgi:signal transduction histidine kinase
MNTFLTFLNKRHPMPKLLYLEWILLAMLLWISVGRTILPSSWFFESARKELSIFLIAVFGLMGIYLPVGQRMATKILFTGIEVLLLGTILFSGGLRGLVLPYFVLVIRSCLIFDFFGQSVVVLIVLTFSYISWRLLYARVILLNLVDLKDIISSFGVLFLIIFFLCLFFILAMMSSLSNEKKSKQELEKANKKLIEYSSLVKDKTQLEERNRIARDIHDSLGHSLTGMNLQLEAAAKLWDKSPETSYRLIGEAKNLASQALQDIRHVVRQLKVTSSLETEIKKLSTEIQKWHPINVNLELLLNNFIPSEIQSQVFRITQEAVSNVVKHAEATELEIRISTTRTLVLMIQDNGKGFQVSREYPGFGLKGIRERSRSLDGTCEIKSSPGNGTMIKVEIPLLEN